MSCRIDWPKLTPGNYRLSCPHCGRASRCDKTLGVTVGQDGAGVAHCFRCAFVETKRSTRQTPQAGPRVVHQAPRLTLSAQGYAIWHMAHPILPGTPAADYLRLRRCALPPEAGHLRWLPAYRHPSGYVGPCLVALLTDTQTAIAQSLHFTWIDGGRKADVTPPRLLFKGHRKAGAVCRLYPRGHAPHGLGIAEGIETALSLAHGLTPVWACIDAGNLAAFPVLPNVARLVIARDRDPAGGKAAAQCAARWAGADREVLVTRQDVNDLNDVLQGLRGAA